VIARRLAEIARQIVALREQQRLLAALRGNDDDVLGQNLRFLFRVLRESRRRQKGHAGAKQRQRPQRSKGIHPASLPFLVVLTID